MLMRALILLVALSATTTPASAAMVWSETTVGSAPITNWSRGSTIEEAMNNARAYAKGDMQVLLTCRQPGWFAYVGSNQDFPRGVSCGFATKEAALYKARLECEAQGGKCDVERLGEDSGVSTNPASASAVPEILPGSSGDVRQDTGMGPVDASAGRNSWFSWW